MSAVAFERRALDALSAPELFELLRLRVDVFVVEQACPYAELDALDAAPGTAHVTGHVGGELVACARTLVPAAADEPLRIGRVAVRDGHRGRGHARALLGWTLAELSGEHPGRAVALGAQLGAEGLYASLGFRRASDEYVEDGIAHVEMLRAG